VISFLFFIELIDQLAIEHCFLLWYYKKKKRKKLQNISFFYNYESY